VTATTVVATVQFR